MHPRRGLGRTSEAYRIRRWWWPGCLRVLPAWVLERADNMMSRKHYISLAQGLNDAHNDSDPSYTDQWNADVKAVADVLAADNPRFNRERFYRACGVDEDRIVASVLGGQ